MVDARRPADLRSREDSGIPLRGPAACGAAARGRSAVRREAEVLRRLDSPVTIDLVELRDDDTTTTMVTIDAGRCTLARPVGVSSDEASRALRRCVAAVSVLHSAGWTHGDLNDLMAKGAIKLEKVKTVELPRKPELLGW